MLASVFKMFTFLYVVKFSFTVCPSGSYLNNNNNNGCDLCPVNTYSSGINVDSCTPCPPGTDTQQDTGQTSQDACGKIKFL